MIFIIEMKLEPTCEMLSEAYILKYLKIEALCYKPEDRGIESR
jgi:hypothetical protein